MKSPTFCKDVFVCLRYSGGGADNDTRASVSRQAVPNRCGDCPYYEDEKTAEPQSVGLGAL